jgi:ABC-2 type transport system ATP-binding protein
VQGLVRRFGARAAVDGLDLDVQRGDVYGFLGPNGAGKTTAIRAILGLIRRDAGTVEIAGDADPVRQRRGVGAMVETPAFHGWLSGRANLELAAAYAGGTASADIDRCLDRVGLGERGREPVRGYSLGMKQRLGIARALLKSPRLLVLDEPTNGLDPRGMREVRDLLGDLARQDGITVFVSSHLLSEVQALCTRVGIIDRGKLKAEGRVSQLLAGLGPSRQVEVGAADVAATRAVIADLAGVRVAGDGEDGRLLVDLGEMEPAELNALLVGRGVRVHALVPRTGNLEEVFLSVTEQRLT